MDHPSFASLRSVNTLGSLLLFLGIVLFNHSMTAWQLNLQFINTAGSLYQQPEGEAAPQAEEARREALSLQQKRQLQQEQRFDLLRQALYIVSSLFVMFLGLQILFKRRWACHFFFSIRQLSQLALLLIPLSTLVLLLNQPLIEALVGVYKPLYTEVMQQRYNLRSYANASEVGVDLVLTDELMRMLIRVTFWIIALLFMGIASLALRLSRRCLRREVQEALLKRAPKPSRLSYFILCLPSELLLLLLLGIYGCASQLLEILLALQKKPLSLPALFLALLVFAGFALSLLQLTNHKMQLASKPEQWHEKYRLLRKALHFSSLAYLLQSLQSILQPLWSKRQADFLSPSAAAGDYLQVMKNALHQMDVLANLAVLLLLFLFYYLLRRSEPHRADDLGESVRVLANGNETSEPAAMEDSQPEEEPPLNAENASDGQKEAASPPLSDQDSKSKREL